MTVLVLVWRGFAGGISVVVLVGKGIHAAPGVMGVLVGMVESRDATMSRPSRSALKRIQ